MIPNSIKPWSLICFILSLCSYVYELLLIQFAGDLSNNNFLIINLSLGTFILGLGLGLKDLPAVLSKEDSIRKLISVEKDLCYLAIFSWALIQAADFLQQHFVGLILTQEVTNTTLILLIEKYHFYILISSVISSLLIGYKSGQELPLILNIANQDNKYTSFFFSLSYLGSVAASFGLNYILKPLFEPSLILLIVISCNLLVFIILNKKITLNGIFHTIFIVGLLSLMGLTKDKVIQVTLKNYYYHFSALNQSSKDFSDILVKDTAYQKINIYHNKNKKILSLNRQFQFSFNNEELYHDALVHVPIKMSNKEVKTVLLLGGGDGLALRELLKYPNIKKIKQIELDQEFTEFCQNDPEIAKLNNYALNEENVVERIYGDAFYLIKQENTTYDLILIDFPYPFSYDLWKLYSLEFYLSVQKRMTNTSILVLDAPVQNKLISKLISNTSANEINSILYSTLKAAHYKTIEFFSFQKEGFVILSKDKIKLDKNFSNFNLLKESTIKRLPEFKKEAFEYNFDHKKVNSIFEPKFLNFTRDF